MYRDGAKTLLRDAKAGVDAVGASWQNANEKNGRKSERNGSSLGAKRSQEPRGLRKQKSVDEPEFEVMYVSVACCKTARVTGLRSVVEVF